MPTECTDPTNPSAECFNALLAQASANDSVIVLGGRLAHDGTCKDGREGQLETAAWDATTLAVSAGSWPNDAQGPATGHYWMGHNYPEFQDRIRGMLDDAR